jgi:hypothetical protein
MAIDRQQHAPRKAVGRFVVDSPLEGAGSNHRSRLQKGPSVGLEFVNRGDPVGFCEREADTGFASGKAENMIA